MSQVALRLPDLLHQYAKQLAAQHAASLNQFIVTAVAEKIAALKTEAFFQQRAVLSSREKFDRVLAKVADRPPVPPMPKARCRAAAGCFQV
jgi:hypothetical protein